MASFLTQLLLPYRTTKSILYILNLLLLLLLLLRTTSLTVLISSYISTLNSFSYKVCSTDLV